MPAALLAFVGGLLLLRWLPQLPPVWSLALLGLVAVPLLYRRSYPLALAMLGFAWACACAHGVLERRLNAELDGRTLWLEGRVVGLPALRDETLRFELDEVSARLPLPSRLRLAWYAAPPLQAGERWRLAVTLKRPRGLANGFGFDAEAGLAVGRIGATGSVKAGERVRAARGPDAWKAAWRQRLLEADAWGRNAYLVALVLGDGSGLRKADWAVLQNTGTLHLMVISGSHIALLGGLLYGLVATLARLGLWPSRLAWMPCACIAALSGAWGYGWVAGLEVPALRACLTLSLILLWRLRLCRPGAWSPLLAALALVLVRDPLASLEPGFWLSFAAVGGLLFGFAGRLGNWRWWHAWGRAQWLSAVTLAPPLLALGLPLSPSGVLANLLAVPCVELLVVPLALLGSLCLALPPLADALLWTAGGVLALLLQGLEWLSPYSPAWYAMAPAGWSVALALLGGALCLAPAGIPGRPLGLALFLPLFCSRPALPEYGYAEVRVLDVGQGLAVLVRTREHAVLYDAGPRRGTFDLGEVAVLPTLRGLGIGRLDLLLVSHADNDHAGGAQAVVAGLPVARVVSGEPERLDGNLRAQACVEREWLLDGVRFSLWQWPAAPAQSNARSCVLRVEAFGESLLLTGDLPLAGESAWLAGAQRAPVDWLLAGHHGSRTASGEAFLRAIAPQAALVSRGWHNAYAHPHPQVLARFAAAGMAVHDTAQEGALSILLGARGPLRGVRQSARFWTEK